MRQLTNIMHRLLNIMMILFRSRGRGGRGMYSAGTTTVDRRPSRILVSGYDAEDKDEVVAHFTKFGEILDQIEDESAPSLIFHYKSRREAELGMQGGKSFAKADLTLAW